MGKVLMSGIVPKLSEPSNFPKVGTPLAECTPEEIQIITQAGQASNYWSVGDMVPITLNGTVASYHTFNNETYYAFILGFDHNSSIEGSNTIHFQFGKTSNGTDIAFNDSYYGSQDGGIVYRHFFMNSDDTLAWSSTRMRNTVCPSFKTVMPTAWQNIIKPCKKYTHNVNSYNTNASYVTATSDDIWLLAEFEVVGIRLGANEAEQKYQKQYDYYKAGNSFYKYKYTDTTSNCSWWLRSGEVGNTNFYFRLAGVTKNGYSPYGIGYSSCEYSYGFAPGFMVA